MSTLFKLQPRFLPLAVASLFVSSVSFMATAHAATATAVTTTTTPINVATAVPATAGQTETRVNADGTTTTITTKSAAFTGSRSKFGTYYQPFAANSLWNARPVNPVFGTAVVPKSSYFPSISAGIYSTGVFLAKRTDPAVTVTSVSGGGVADPDIGGYRTVTIPHFPADVIPASGGDGHADIVDQETGIIHSFWQLRKKADGKWTATLYSWSPLNGKGFGDPAHYYQGARAVGVASTAGLLRTHEINDGQPIYNHALAMSMTYNSLSKSPTYIFPATSADSDAARANYGAIPQGALMMLPPTFDTSKIANKDLKKVADTLKVYGAYVVDRNDGTPFALYAEIGSGYNLMPKGWDNTIASQLDQIRAGLRQVTSASQWLDGNGVAFNPEEFKKENILSMRGPWDSASTAKGGGYDSWAQALVFPATTQAITVQNTNGTGISKVSWAKINVGDTMKLTNIATGGATLTMSVWQGSKVVSTLGPLKNGDSARVVWPSGGWMTLKATSGVGAASSVKADFVKVTP